MPTNDPIALSGGGRTLIVQPADEPAARPCLLAFGRAPLGMEDAKGLMAATPQPRWGARLDTPCPLTLFPLPFDGSNAPAALELADGTVPPPLKGKISRTEDGLHWTGQSPTLTADLWLKLCPQTGCLTARAAATSQKPIKSLTALTWPLPSRFREILTLGGDWANEFRPTRRPLDHGSIEISSHRGRHGHDVYPMLIAGTDRFGEDEGELVAIVLGWSGNARLAAHRLREGYLVLEAEALTSSPQQRIDTPPAYLIVSDQGLNGLRAAIHDFVRTRIMPSGEKTRPVHLNTWEAVYFAHDEAGLMDLGRSAAALGVERFVLDDGWFKGRDHDRSSLGDWTPDSSKYPKGLTPLITAINQAGMEFGLWVEPEMANPDSDLARAHPDWLRLRPTNPVPPMRHQRVLDLGRKEIADHLFKTLDELLTRHPIAYLKWDMNSDLTEPASDPAADHTAALVQLLARLRDRHKGLEIETCASGGGRCDWGILQHTDRVWVSDSNDALDRLRINRWASLALPLRAMGTHVGPEACHITGRRASLDLRAAVALFGSFGLELDIRTLDDRTRTRLAEHIAIYKRHRALIHEGIYRIIDADDDHHADMVMARDGGEAILRVIRTGSTHLGQTCDIQLRGLQAQRVYHLEVIRPVSASVEDGLAPAIRDGTLQLRGHTLGTIGLKLALTRPESAVLLHLRAD